MGVPVDEARRLYKTVKGYYRELYHTHTYLWSVYQTLQFVQRHHAEAVSTSRAEPILRHLRRVIKEAECSFSSDGGAANSSVMDGKALDLLASKICMGEYVRELVTPVQMRIQSIATWLHIFCALLCARVLNQTPELSEAVERSFENDLDTSGQPHFVEQARHRLHSSLVAAVRASSNTSDFQAAVAKAVPLLLPLVTSSKERDWLLVLIGRLVSNISDVAEGELRQTLTWLATNSQELHREIRQKVQPLQKQLDAIKSSIASMHRISAAETSHWDGLLHEALHNLHESGTDTSTQIAADARMAAEQVLAHLRNSDNVPACPVVGLPYTLLPPTSPTDSTNELKNNCRAVTLTGCGCCMSVFAARRAISGRKCPLCSEVVMAGSGYRDNACMSRAAQLWAAGMTPAKLKESDIDVDLDARLRLPARAVADGVLCRGKMRGTGEALAVLVMPLGETAHWERAGVNHALVVSAAAAALTPLMCTVVGVCWRANDVWITFPAEYLLDGHVEVSDDSEGAQARSGTLTSATQLVARISMEAESTSNSGLSTTDALELGLSLAEVQRVACDNMLAAPHPSFHTLTPDNVFFTADGCSVRIPFWTPLSLPCVPPKVALRLREAAAQTQPMAHSATRSPSTRYTAPEVVNSTSLDHTASFGHTVAFAAPAAAAMQTVNAEKAAVFTVGAVLQFCTSGEAPPSAEELLSKFTMTLPLGSSSRFHEAASRHLHASSDMTLRMATRVASAMDPDVSVRPSLDALQGMLMQELAALEHPLTTIAEGDTEEATSSVEHSGRQSTAQCATGNRAAGTASVQQSADIRAGDSESSLHRSGSRLRPAWDRSDSAQRTLPLAQPQHVQPPVFVPPQAPPDCPSTPLQSSTPLQADVATPDVAPDAHSVGDDTSPSQGSTGLDTTERSITGGAGHTGAGGTTSASRRSTYSTRDFPPAEFKPVEVKPWEPRLAMQAAQAAPPEQPARSLPPTHSRQNSKEVPVGSPALSSVSSRPTAFDAQGEWSAQGQPERRPTHFTPPVTSPRGSFGASDPTHPGVDSPQKSGLESRNSSFGTLQSPQTSFDMRGHRAESYGSGDAGRGASSPRHLSKRSMSGSKKGSKTLQQLVQSMNSGSKGMVNDLAGCSYKSSKGWFASLSNLSRLSSTPSLSSRSSIPAPLPDQDHTGSALSADNMQLVQTPINLSDSAFNARSIFELQKAPSAVRGSIGAAKMHVTCGHTTVANGKLLLPSGGQLVLGPGCVELEFKDITFQDGTILCHGVGCAIKFTNCILDATQVLVVEGAHVTISSDNPQPAKRNLASAAACMQNIAIAVFASGAGTRVVMQDVVVEHCQQAICADGGARVEMRRVDVYGMNITGCEVRGSGSVMSLQACRVFAATVPAQPNWRIQGVWAHSGAQCTIEQCSIERVPSGVAADGQGTHVSISESWIRGNAACGVFVGYGARAEISMSSLDVHSEAGQFIGLHVMGQRSHATVKNCTARGNSGYGVHVSEHAYVVADRVNTQDNGYGAWLVEGHGARAELESCESRNETAYCSKQGGNIKKLLCRP